MPFEIMQWNCRGLISKWAEVKPFLAEKSSDAMCIQETHFLPADQYDFRINNYTIFNCYSNDNIRKGGACIYIKNDYPHFQVQLNTSLQAVACSVRIGRMRVTICSLYLPPNESFLYADLNDLTSQLPQPYIMCSDANSKHFLWGSDRCDRRGGIWEQLIRQHALNVLNTGCPTRLDDYTGLWSHIDITLSTSDIGQYMEWRTDDDLCSSDHCPIYVSCDLNERTPTGENTFHGWNINKAKWTEFQERCQLRFCAELGIDNCSIMTEELVQTASECVPQRTGKSKYSCPWWTEECKTAIRERKKALNRFRRTRLTALLMEYKRAKAKARQVIRRAKKESWEKLLHMFNYRTPVRQLWEVIRKFTKKERIQRALPVLNIGGNIIDDPHDVGNALGRFFSDISSSTNYRPNFQTRLRLMSESVPELSSDNHESYNDVFNIDELKRSVTECGNTSIGPDKVHYAFFKHLTETQLLEILNLINYIWTTEIFPLEWKHSIVIPILKPGKPGNKPESYRPIQLTSCFCKLMERMVAKRLNWYVEHNNMISKYQCAFKKGRSTIDHLLRLESEIRKGFFYNRYTLAVFLDLKSAYNLTSTVALLTKMHTLGFRGRMMNFLKGYLDERTFQVKCGGLSDIHTQENGLVQGGVISPVLFNIAINDIFANVPEHISKALCADDCSMWVQGRHIRVLIEDMQYALDEVSRWTDNWGFIFTPPKCNAVIFRRYMKSRELLNIPELKIYDQPLEYLEHVKFLGVILDTRLNYNRHIQYVKSKSLKRISLLKCLAGRGCGADRTVLLRIYKSMIRPILDYGSQILDGPGNKAVEGLESIQNTCLRIVTGALRTSPILPLLVETNIFPLYMRRMDLSLRYCMKMQGRDDHPCQELIDDESALHTVDRSYMKRISGFPLYERLAETCDNLTFVFPHDIVYKQRTIPTWELGRCKLEKLTEEKKDLVNPIQIQCAFQEYRQQHTEYDFIFTDGSKSIEGVGCAFIHGDRHEKHKLPEVCSIFTAESVAILQTLQYIQTNEIHKCVVCTDSLSVVTALKDITSEHPVLIEVMSLYHRITENGSDVIVLWIPGHCGIIGNEKADRLAKAAIFSDQTLECRVGYREYFPILRQSLREYFNQLWSNYNPHTNLKEIKEEVGNWDTSRRQNRREEIVLCRLRLGHSRLTHSYIMDREPRPQCSRCRSPLSIKHILIECPEYTRQRTPIVTSCNQHQIPVTLRSVLGDEYPDIIDEVFKFLRDCQLLKLL